MIVVRSPVLTNSVRYWLEWATSRSISSCWAQNRGASSVLRIIVASAMLPARTAGMKRLSIVSQIASALARVVSTCWRSSSGIGAVFQYCRRWANSARPSSICSSSLVVVSGLVTISVAWRNGSTTKAGGGRISASNSSCSDTAREIGPPKRISATAIPAMLKATDSSAISAVAPLRACFWIILLVPNVVDSSVGSSAGRLR